MTFRHLSHGEVPKAPIDSPSHRTRATAAIVLGFVAGLLFAVAPAQAAGSTLYVSASAGSDPACASASQSNPFATIAGALACASNGSTIKIGAGSFAGGFTITHNVTLLGAGAATVITDPSAPVETVTEVTIAGGRSVTLNSLTVNGGGLQHDVVAGSGALRVINSTITGGVADHGGGINVEPATGTTSQLTVLRSTISNNLAFTVGGGIAISDGPGKTLNSASVIDSTITDNQANTTGGGIKTANSVSLTVRDSTIAHNQATQAGGGLVYASGSGPTVTPPVMLTNTIVAANTADTAPDCRLAQGVNDGGHNLIGALDATCPGITDGVNGDQAGTPNSPLDPGLGQLTSNGGPTQTLALLLGSPAIGTGDPTDCQAKPVNNTDQRNHSRNANIRQTCDTGAYDTGGN